MSILPPELDSNYEILQEMHAGGMGAVYKARHRHLDEVCVIKIMHSRLNEVQGARERFFGEAKKGKQLRHGNIAEVLNFHVATDGTAYLIVELVDGTNLRDLLAARGPFDPKLAVTVGVQALEALSYLHSKKLVHRDISPDNLMLTRDAAGEPLVKLIDLGIAKSVDEVLNLTSTGLFVGKVRYAAPEQFRQQVDPRSDLYSLGVVLYELLTGTMPMIETDAIAVMAASLKGDPPRSFDETDPRGRVPERLRAVILEALEKNAGKRYQTAGEFSEALQRSLPGLTETAVVNPPLTPTEPATQVRPLFPRPAAIAAGVLLVIIAVAATFRMTRKPEVAQPQRGVVTAAVTEVTVTAPAAVTPDQQKVAGEALTRGKALVSEGRMAAAYAAFTQATNADPTNAYAWANLGGAAALLKKPDEARKACERALSIDPDNWLAHYNLACQLTGSGKRDEALRHIEITLAQLKRQARTRDELQAVMNTIRADEALGELRNDPRFGELLASN